MALLDKTMLETALIVPILVPILIAVLFVLLDRLMPSEKKDLTKLVTNAISVLGALGLGGLALFYMEYHLSTGTEVFENNDLLTLVMDDISLFFFVLFSAIFVPVVLFSLAYMDKDRTTPIYYALLFVIFAGLVAIVIVGDFFSLFIAWEIMALASYSLVSYERHERFTIEAGFKYLIMSSFGSLAFLFGLTYIYGELGTLNFSEIAGITIPDTFIHNFAIIAIVVGFGVTGGIIFLNQWLPDAHPSAPSPVSALLSGIVVKAGIYGILRSGMLLFPGQFMQDWNFMYTEWSLLLIILGLATATEGNIMMIVQFRREKGGKDIKRILAYSTTIHLGYILIALGVGGQLGITAAIFYAFNHAFTKAMLFLVSGYILVQYGTRDLDKLRGIGRKDTYLAIVASIGILSLGGLPFTGGFIAKLLVIFALVDTSPAWGDLTYVMTFVLLLNALVAFFSALWFVKFLVTDPEPEDEPLPTPETSPVKTWLMRGIVGVLALVTLVLGVIPADVIITISNMAAAL